jgi:predicted ester cyclase
MPTSSQEHQANAELARRALERVCSGAGVERAEHYYSPSFIDHVNGRDLHGIEGAEASVAGYRRVIRDMSIRVEDQFAEGNVVTSRFTVAGTIYGRAVKFDGITVSRIEDGKIVEDWSVTDTLTMLRQAGVLRTLLLLVRG